MAQSDTSFAYGRNNMTKDIEPNKKIAQDGDEISTSGATYKVVTEKGGTNNGQILLEKEKKSGEAVLYCVTRGGDIE